MTDDEIDLNGDLEDAVLITELHRRMAGDSGVRIPFETVLAEFGFTRADLDEPLGCSIQERCGCGPQPDDRVRFHRRGSEQCRAEATP